MDQPALVRIATPDDVEALFWHLMQEYAPVNSVPVPIHPMAVLETVRACCGGKGAVAGVIESRSLGIVASVGLEAAVPWFSKQDLIRQIWLFVSPAARGKLGLERQLFEFAEWHREDMSKRLGYDTVLEQSVMSLDRLPAKRRLWRRYGREIGATFWTGGALSEQDDKKYPDLDAGQSGGDRRLHRPRK